ncbi:hypothetical protein NRP93_003176 [Clostridium botulinum]|nr:hypothetical protein [Clostridium botulinum]
MADGKIIIDTQIDLKGAEEMIKNSIVDLGITMFEKFKEPFIKSLDLVMKSFDKLSDNIINGDLGESLDKLALDFGNFIDIIADGSEIWIPKIIDALVWIVDNASIVASGISGIGIAMLALNVGSTIANVAGKFKLLYLEIATGTPIMEAFNIVLGLNPIGLITAAIIGCIAALVVLWSTNEDFRNFIIEIWNSILYVGKTVWGWLVNFFTVDIPTAWQSVVDFFASIPEWLSNLWLTIQQAFVDGWNVIVNFFTVTIPVWINQIFNWFNELPYLIGFALGYVLTTIIMWGVNTWNYLITNVPIWINNIGNFFSKLPSIIWTWLVNTLNNIVLWGQQTYTNMVNAVNNAINAVVQWFSTLPNRIWQWLLNTISMIGQFAISLASTARAAGSNMVNNIIGAVTNLPSQFANIGRNIVQGVWNGITGMGGWIRDRINGFFSGVVDGAKSVLGIHSPSRVFRDQVGKYMAQGVGIGFQDETENVKSSMGKDLYGLISKMQMTVDHEVAITTARVVANRNTPTDATVTNNNDNALNVNIENFNNTKNQDVQSLMEELEFYRKQNSLAKGGI